MTPLVFGPGGQWDILILAIVALILFGGTKLAGFGRNAGKAIREFKEETQSISKEGQAKADAASGEVADAELIEPRPNVEQKPENRA